MLTPDVVAVSKRCGRSRSTAWRRRFATEPGASTDAMRHLAGLHACATCSTIPRSKDIVLAGPAQGWMTDLTGRVVGINNGRPTLQLQDLVVALRAFPPGGKETPLIGCSIDPTPEGLAAMQEFLKSVGIHATPAQTQYIVDGLQTQPGATRTCRSTAFRPRRISPRSWSRPTTG